ncbi:MAG: PepSY-associated TM helix domain-containing protein [Pseudomonadota bacterium]
MLRERYLRIYDLHSWSGVVLGLFLFVVSITGCFALFDHEIKTWEDQNLRLSVPAEPVPIHDKFVKWVTEGLDGNEPVFVSFSFPDAHEPYYLARYQYRTTDKELVLEKTQWNPATGEVLAARGGGLSEWVLDFHRDLMWPESLGGRQVGRALVGLAGIIMMLSIISGVLSHTKIIREFLTLRFNNTIRLKWTDTHKALGLWVLPFYTMISFTGAFLGIIVILLPLIAALAFKGDTDALVEAVLGAPTEATGEYAQMMSVDELRELRNPRSDLLPDQLTVSNWGDSAAEYRVFYEVDRELGRFEVVTLNGVTGEQIDYEPINQLSPANRLSNAMTPLHYGTFGGIWLKVLYFVLGLSLCVLIVTGLMMWLERRMHGKEGNKSSLFYSRLGKATIGSTLGLPIATASLLYLDKLYLGAEDQRIWWTGVVYFAVWFTTIGLCFIGNTGEYRLVRRLLFTTGILFAAIPLLNLSYYMNASWPSLTQPWAAVDLGLFIAGALTFALTSFIPTERKQPQRHARGTSLLDLAMSK